MITFYHVILIFPRKRLLSGAPRSSEPIKADRLPPTDLHGRSLRFGEAALSRSRAIMSASLKASEALPLRPHGLSHACSLPPRWRLSRRPWPLDTRRPARPSGRLRRCPEAFRLFIEGGSAASATREVKE